jgi:hypothetical protein
MKMPSLSRRSLLRGVVGSTALGTVGFSFGLNTAAADDILSLGVMPPGHLPFKGQDGFSSVLTIIRPSASDQKDLVTTKILPLRGAHSVLATGNGFAVIGNINQLAFLSSSYDLRRVVTALPGYEFGGHAVWIASEQKILVALRPGRENENRDKGQLVLIDEETGAIQKVGQSGGYDPHDMIRLETGQIAVCNYGNKQISDLRSYYNLEPSVALVDAANFSLLDVIPGPTIGSLSHICEGPSGSIGAIPAKLHILSQDSLNQVKQSQLGVEVPLTAAEIAEGKVGFPSPVLTYSFKDKAWKSFLRDPGRQRRPQSIVYDKKTENYFVTYPFSEQIVRLSSAGTVDFLSGFDLGISYPRGLCIGSQGQIYVSGQYRGLASFDSSSLKPIERYDVQIHDGTHIFSAKAV